MTPLTFSRARSPSPRSATTLTLTPLATSVPASLRTRVSLGNLFSTSIRTLPADAFICLFIPAFSEGADEVDNVPSVDGAHKLILQLRTFLGQDDDFRAVQGAFQR